MNSRRVHNHTFWGGAGKAPPACVSGAKAPGGSHTPEGDLARIGRVLWPTNPVQTEAGKKSKSRRERACERRGAGAGQQAGTGRTTSR